MPWLLVTWRRKEPGHQHLWYWPCCSFFSTSGIKRPGIIVSGSYRLPWRRLFSLITPMWIDKHTWYGTPLVSINKQNLCMDFSIYALILRLQKIHTLLDSTNYCWHETAIIIRGSGNIDGLAQDSSNSNALAIELPQSCTKPSICMNMIDWLTIFITMFPEKYH